MSWMDAWSRPPKHAQFPPPLYLTSPSGVEVPYCHTCGRVISSRRKPASSTSSGGKKRERKNSTGNARGGGGGGDGDNSRGANTSASSTNAQAPKYCSERCRRGKPGNLDRKVEEAFVAVLTGEVEAWRARFGVGDEEGGKERREKDRTKMVKGEKRVIAWCGEVETLVFGERFDPLKTAGRRRNRRPRGVVDEGEWKSVDMESHSEGEQDEAGGDSYESDDSGFGMSTSGADGGGVLLYSSSEVDHDHISFGAGKKRPEQSKAEVNGSVGGEKSWAEKIAETGEMARKRLEGQKRAEEKELVKRAARRGVVFGFLIEDEGKQRKDAISDGGGRKKKDEKKSLEKVGDEEVRVARRKCEAVATKAAVVVEPSFVKGDWGIRWRED